jgi:hypothetical protein
VRPKKVLPKKPSFLGLVFNWQNSSLAKTFLGALFTKIKYTFLKSERKDGFLDTTFAIFEEKRKDNEGQYLEKQFFEKQFFINRS